MAFSPLQSKTLHHNRSLSLPCKSDPSISHFNEKLSTLVRDSEASFSSLNNRLNNLKNLYTETDDLLMLPHIQQECEEKWVDQILDGYISLLDACTTVKDLVSNTKEDLQELLSSLRRSKDSANGVRCYLSSRRKSKKIIQKCLKDLRSNFTSIINASSETTGVACTLKETELAAVTVFESLLSYLNGAKIQAKRSGWSIVSKMMQSKKVVSEDEGANVNEFEKIDGLLQTSVENEQVEQITTHLKGMDSSIQSLEQELESLFRQLIRSRVSLLNILNH
ncbi:hypothetical protein MIMGU_mgv1a019954mg [Erythranthe guttata]|uniref:Uncharacterized protein n=1 Tax=Erythranthe guttata TaxID=4155 RepID=A0A022RJY1_ERYGU|nr:PREDICTED: uncharacterized protein LOC105954655 [Erythranthe guttata]EYU40466.1 hypothetical protein MIMGU_mgv1a019954mg [Erythranthe guttata]|eukprot:XP_012833780.1 PREDICTED: uncharacterized protein LOC105954655 [Erythranthe guttata]